MIAEDTSPTHTLKELLSLYPGAQRALFKLYHLGGCSSCGIQLDESLLQLCTRNGLDPAEVIKNLVRSQVEEEQMSIHPIQLAEEQKAQELRILDIRTREEYEAVRLPNSILFTQELMEEIMNQWPREELLVILDHRGTRSLDAAAYFSGHGFNQVKSLKGGIDAWAEYVDSSFPRYTVE